MTKEQEDAIVSAYLGICVLQTMTRKVGLTMATERCGALLSELSEAFPGIYQRVLIMSLRQQKGNS